MLTAEISNSGQILKEYVYGSGSHTPDYMIAGSSRYRIVTDHLGSPRLVVNALTGQVVQKISYNEFGKILLDTNSCFQAFGFAGGIVDPDSHFVRFGVRDYDPVTARWTSRDPILFEAGDTNLYGYVMNDPVNMVDPTGEYGVLGAGIAAAIEIGIQAIENYNDGCDVLDYNNYDGRDIALSAAIGAAAPGAIASGKNIARSARAISALSAQLSNARTANRSAKLAGRISKHQDNIKGIAAGVAATQGAKAIAKGSSEGKCGCSE